MKTLFERTSITVTVMILTASVLQGQVRFDPPVNLGISFDNVHLGSDKDRVQRIIGAARDSSDQRVVIEIVGADSARFQADADTTIISFDEEYHLNLNYRPRHEGQSVAELKVTVLREPDAVNIVYRAALKGRGTHYPPPRVTGESMSVLIDSFGGGMLAADGELACFTPGGLVAGLCIVIPDSERWGMAIWGDDAFTDTTDGFTANQPLLFRYWDPFHRWELETHFDVIDGRGTYGNNAITELGMTLSVGEEISNQPVAFALASAFPNPFNSTTTVQWSIPKAGETTLSLFDLGGRKLFDVQDGYAEAGGHSISLNLNGRPAGPYLIGLEAGGARAFQRILLLK